MSDLIINKAIVHQLNKEQHRPIQPSNLRETVLDAQNGVVMKLVNGIVSLYGTSRNTANFGTFKEGEGRGAFPDKFIGYSTLTSVSNQEFVNLSKSAMDSLYTLANQETASSGGYIFFADYTQPQHGRFFVIAMIKQKEGVRLSPNLEPEELLQLDLNRLYQAAKINFGNLSGYLAAEVNARTELNYLSFISPSSSKTAAGYFVTALGCFKGTASSRATDTLIRESVKYFWNEDTLRPHSKSFKKDMIALLEEKVKTGITVKLSEIDALARSYMRETEQESIEIQSNRFITHLNSEDIAVPAEFQPSKNVLKKHVYIRHKATNWEINIKRDCISEDPSAQICYNRGNGSIIINNIPKTLKEDIESQLGSEN